MPNILDTLGTCCTRRAFLGKASAGIGTMALASLLNSGELLAAADPKSLASRGMVNPLHFPPKAKRVIWLYQSGGPTHLETFDHKPQLAKLHGQPMPESFTKGQPIAQLQGAKLNCFGPQFGFKRFGKSGQEICELFPHLGSIADEMCIIRSMKTEAINHDPAHTFMNTGSTISGRPAAGSWTLYGLGSENQDLPGFIVLTSTGRGGQMQPISSRMWHSGFLPSRYQGVKFQSRGDAVYYLGNPPGVTPQRQHETIDTIDAINRLRQEAVDDPEIATRIAQYELAFRMQTSVPELMDLTTEPQARAGDVRHDGQRRFVCGELPPGPAAGRAGRAFHPGLPSRLGHARRLEARHADQRQGDRSGLGRARSRISSSAGCWTTRWSSGAASSAARR